MSAGRPRRGALSAAALAACLVLLPAAGAGAEGSAAAPRHARGFSVERREGFTCLTVPSPWPGAGQSLSYALVPRGGETPPGFPAARVIEVPVRSVVTLSATYLAELEMLGLTGRIVGHADLARVYSPALRERAARGLVREVGAGGGGVNVERVLELEPELVLAYGLGNAYDVHDRLEALGLKVVIDADWLEATPLGRAEWITFLAFFFNREDEAERIFSRIEREYLALAARARGAAERPSVLLDAPFQDTWWTAGGDSYMAALLLDAGARYLWADLPGTASRPLDFEAVYERAADADFWLHPGTWGSLAEGRALDERFAAFRAFREGRVYANSARRLAGGGNDYWESGPANPQRVLADLIAIFHPGLLPERSLYYYRRLEAAGEGGR